MKGTFVVLQRGGTQHIVSEGDEISVNRLLGKKGDTLTLNDVLLFQDGEKTSIGNPVLPMTVSAEIAGHYQGEKLEIMKFKAKARYRRHTGHRQQLTKVTITKISGTTTTKADTKPVAATPAKAPRKKTATTATTKTTMKTATKAAR